MDIKELIQKYSLAKDDCWLFERENKKTGFKTSLWIITHDACEKIMAMEKIKLENIHALNSEKDFVRFLITMSKGDVRIMSVGEADKSNSQSSYIGCIAEKRGIDRCILKLIDAYQYGVYSETENENFEKTSTNKILDDVSQNIPPKQVGFSEKADRKRKREELLKKAGDYKSGMTESEIAHFTQIKNDMNADKPYPEDVYDSDCLLLNSIIYKIEKGMNKAFDGKPALTDDSDVMPELLTEDEQKKDDLPEGVL